MSTSSASAPGDPITGSRFGTDDARRVATVHGLFGIALIHLLDLPGKLKETPYLGVGYLGLIVATLVVAEMFLRGVGRWAWLGAAALSAAVLTGYVINRTVGLPGATDDIGNWLEPLGLASLFVEGLVLLLSLEGLRRSTRSRLIATAPLNVATPSRTRVRS